MKRLCNFCKRKVVRETSATGAKNICGLTIPTSNGDVLSTTYARCLHDGVLIDYFDPIDQGSEVQKALDENKELKLRLNRINNMSNEP